MKALIWKNNGNIELVEKPKPAIMYTTDAVVKVTRSSICTSDLHILHGAVNRAVEGTALGHEFVGIVEDTGSDVKSVKKGDRVAVNCITYCGKCWFCKRNYINNCQNGGWELGCTIDGGHAEYARIPYADSGLTKIPDNVTDDSALFVGDILSSGYFGAELCEINKNDTIAVIGAGPVGLCAMQCARLLGASTIIALDINENRLAKAKDYGLADIIINPQKENAAGTVNKYTSDRGADGVIEAAGTDESFQTAWKIARPNAVVAVVAMYEKNQIIPLPGMYGKNLIFKTGGVDAIHCERLLQLISENKLSTDFLITGKYNFCDIVNAYEEFERNKDVHFKIAITY